MFDPKYVTAKTIVFGNGMPQYFKIESFTCFLVLFSMKVAYY